MVQRKIFLGCFLLAAVVLNGHAQNIFSDLRSAEKKGDYYASHLSYSKAIHFYSQALLIKKNKKNHELNKKAADLYKKMARYEEAKKCFQNMMEAGQSLSGQDSIHYFNILKACTPMESDAPLLNAYSAKVLRNLFRDTLYYTIRELPFNSSHSEYCPVSFGNGILYVSDKEPATLVKTYNALNDGGFASMYFREKEDSGWGAARPTTAAIENVLHIGPACFYDNQKKAVLNICVKESKKPYRLLLYTGVYDSLTNQWKDLQPMPFNHSSYSVGHPAMSEDGRTIFFVSDKRGGQGGTDLYFSRKLNGKWTDPVNMGPEINSKGDEKYPCLSRDNILFFSSDGRYGMGGMDIYSTDLSASDTLVQNMGAPVNSSLDDFSFHYDENRKTGYFSSNRKNNGKQDDLFSMKENKILLQIEMKDDFDKKDLAEVHIELWDHELNIPVKHFQGDKFNTVHAWLRPAHQYKMVIQKEDYRNDTMLISTYHLSDSLKVISEIRYLQRKYMYYGNLKLSSNDQVINDDTSLVIINNITLHAVDSIASVGPSFLIKLDSECEYIITSRTHDTLRYIYVEKKNSINSSGKAFYNMYLSSAQPKVFRVIIRKCAGTKQDEFFERSTIMVVDWVNRNEIKIVPGPDGDFQFVVTDTRLFDLTINEKKIFYSKQEIRTEECCLEFIE